MRRRLIIFLTLIYSGILGAQQMPQYSHYLFNQFQLNPAVAGTKECLDVRFGYRTQWVGFDAAPRTGLASINTRLGKPSRTGTSHAAGLIFESDNTEPTSRTLMQVAYAYQFKMSREMRGSIGLFAGFSQYRINLSEIIIEDADDPVLALGSDTQFLVPEITPGFWMYDKRFYLGIAARYVTGNKIFDVGEATLQTHWNVSSGYTFFLAPKVNLIPSTMIRYVAGAPISLDLNAMLDFNRTMALGMGYRNGDAFVAMAKINLFNSVTLAYAYDITTSPINVASSNSHEIIIGISACPEQSRGGFIPCAAYD